MGVSIAAMLYRAERMLNIARPVSVIFAAAAFVATVAGLLGGLTPLTRALDQASFAIGRHSISALDIVTTALVAAALFARSEEHTSELQSLMRLSYAVFCLKKQTTTITTQ